MITVYDEEGNVDPVIEELYPVIARLGQRFEVVYCDDASSDHTRERFAAAQRRHANLRIVRHRDYGGLSHSLNGIGILQRRLLG